MKTSYVWNSCLLIYTHNERNAYTPVKKITEKNWPHSKHAACWVEWPWPHPINLNAPANRNYVHT